MRIAIALALFATTVLVVWGTLLLFGVKNAVLRAFAAITVGPLLFVGVDCAYTGYLDPFWAIGYFFCIPIAAVNVILFEVLTSMLDSAISKRKTAIQEAKCFKETLNRRSK
jgi:hypothetical protein